MQHLKRAIRSLTYCSLVLATFAGAAAFPRAGLAQEADYPSNADTHPGQIVYSRDVPYGMATRRFSQGEASTVSPDQSVLIESTLLTGLQPITDAEQALISAPLTRSLQVGTDALDTGLSVLTGTNGNSDFTRSESGGSATGNIISNSLSVLPSALAVIGQSTGRGE